MTSDRRHRQPDGDAQLEDVDMTHLHKPHDVVVVGARCAGAATALLLARAGLRVLMVDRTTPDRDVLSTHALTRTGVFLLDRFGVLDAVREAGTPPVVRSEMGYGARRVGVDIRPSHGVDALYAPRRPILDGLLVEAAVAAGADVVLDVTVTDVLRDGDRVVGVVGRRGRTPFRAAAALTIGADGLSSTVARAVQAPVIQRGLHAGSIWYVYATGVVDNGYRMFFRRGAVAGMTPTNGGASCVFVGMPPDRFEMPERTSRWQALLARFGAVAPDVAADLRAAECVSGVRGWAGHPGMRRRAFGAGWALVGDAGYFKDPLGTHGISQALRDAQLLSDAMLHAADGSVSTTTALAGYERTRDALSAGMFTVTDALASYQWDSGAVEHHMRHLSDETSREIEAVAALTGAPASHARTA